jgi:hypothetical protein
MRPAAARAAAPKADLRGRRVNIGMILAGDRAPGVDACSCGDED